MERLHGFDPIINRDCRAIVLGSFPGVASLDAGNYYAHPRNQFWPIVSAVLGMELPALSFADRYARLLDHRVGLWDVIRDCDRIGSLDQAIRNEKHASLASLHDEAPYLRFLLLNGRKAQIEARKVLTAPEADRYVLLNLPSTSPAHAAMSFEQKLVLWRAAFRQAGIDKSAVISDQR